MTDRKHCFIPGPLIGKTSVAWGATCFEHQLCRDDRVIPFALKQARGADGADCTNAFEHGRLNTGGKRVLDIPARAGPRDG